MTTQSLALLKPQSPGVYTRPMVYDPTWTDPAGQYTGQKVIPAVGSLVKDIDNTPLWVVAVDPVTYVPTYTAVPLSTDNENAVSTLNYGATVLRLYADYRALPYPVTPDSKCIFIGKSPRFYELVRYPGTASEVTISQYFDTSGKFTSEMVPLIAADHLNSSWYLPRCHISVHLDPNEEIGVKIYSEDGIEVHSATLFAKESAVINQDVIYSPTIVRITVSGIQQLADGTFYLFEKQDFDSLGLTVTVVYDNGSTASIPLDGDKCILYGQDDFISSFAGLKQDLTVKYFRSSDEAINPNIADPTGSMISVTVPVTVISNALAVTNKIIAIPSYNANLARYIVRYWLYFADGRGHVDVTPYVSIKSGTLRGDSALFGVIQVYTVGLDMHDADPVNYPTSAIYQQNIVIRFNPPNTLVKWTLRDAQTSTNVYGQDNSQTRRPSIKFDAARQQYFIPASVFANQAAFINSFYTKASPPYDPAVSQIPQQPTHFIVRDILTGTMLTPALIPVGSYAQAFNFLNDSNGAYVNAVVMVEFINVINSSTRNILFGAPVDVSTGTYVG